MILGKAGQLTSKQLQPKLIQKTAYSLFCHLRGSEEKEQNTKSKQTSSAHIKLVLLLCSLQLTSQLTANYTFLWNVFIECEFFHFYKYAGVPFLSSRQIISLCSINLSIQIPHYLFQKSKLNLSVVE